MTAVTSKEGYIKFIQFRDSAYLVAYDLFRIKSMIKTIETDSYSDQQLKDEAFFKLNYQTHFLVKELTELKSPISKVVNAVPYRRTHFSDLKTDLCMVKYNRVNSRCYSEDVDMFMVGLITDEGEVFTIEINPVIKITAEYWWVLNKHVDLVFFSFANKTVIQRIKIYSKEFSSLWQFAEYFCYALLLILAVLVFVKMA